MLLPLLALVPLVTPLDLEELSRVRATHAAALAELGAECIESGLFNDAERLLLEAKEWSPEESTSTARLATLRERRIASVQDDAEQDRKRFVGSRDYHRLCETLGKKEADLADETVDALLAVARDSEEETVKDQALLAALDLGADGRDLKRVAGRERLDRLQRHWNEMRGIESLELGDTIAGRDITLEDLRGKVVLWRSFSL